MSQIKFENITKEYNTGKPVLDGVSFSVDKGDFVFIVGPSGAGKSTLVKLLIREIEPNEGTIWFDGLEIDEVEVDEEIKSLMQEDSPEEGLVNIFELPYDKVPKLRRKIGVVFQDFKVLNSKNVFENVAVALEVVNTDKQVINDLVPNVLGLVGLSGKEERFPPQLSGGERQRLSIARALAHEPDVIVADEPTGMIDPESADRVLDVLEKVNSRGTTIIMATHDANIVNKLKKRVIRLEDGKIKSDKKEGSYD